MILDTASFNLMDRNKDTLILQSKFLKLNHYNWLKGGTVFFMLESHLFTSA